MNNGANQIQGKFWDIDVTVPAGGKSVSLGNQTAIDNKNVVTIQICQNEANENNNTLQKTGFFIELEREGKNKMTIPSDNFANPANPTVFVLNDKTIFWNKSQIVFPDNDSSPRYVKLIVIYED
jgi:hypothetical protein